MSNPVMRLLQNPDGAPALDLFVGWCASKNVRAIPASPAMVATFIRESQHLGIESLAAVSAAVSAAHQARGLADPAAGSPVSVILNQISGLQPPNSWKREFKELFPHIPIALQRYLSEREKENTKEIKRAQNEAATARKELAEAKKAEAANATQTQEIK